MESCNKKLVSSDLGRDIWLARFIPILFIVLLSPLIASAFTVSPTLREYEIERGGTAEGSILIRNDRAANIEVEAVVRNFIARDEYGSPQFIEIPDNLAEWIQILEKKFAIARGASRRVDYTIAVPKYARSGGYSAGILFTEKSRASSGISAVIGNQLASLVLVRVPGDILEKGRIAEFFIEKLEKNPMRIQFAVRFENLGNVFLKPYGKITIRNLFDKKVSEIFINDSGGNVLPESGRKFNATWQDKDEAGGVRKFYFGRYTAELEMFYGEGNTKETKKVSFWLVSRQGVIAFMAIMVASVFLIWKIIKRIRGRRFFVERI